MERREINFDAEQVTRFIWPGIGLLALVAVGFLGFNSFYTVQENENAVVMRFGKYHATTPPGFHLRIPLVDKVVKVNLTEERRVRLPFGVRGSRGESLPEDSTLMLTGDLNAASVEWTVAVADRRSEAKDFEFSRSLSSGKAMPISNRSLSWLRVRS